MWKKMVPADGNIGGPYGLFKEVYGWNGEQYPRLVITIHPHESHIENVPQETGIKVDCDIKDDAEAWWSNGAIPRELIPDLISILIKVQALDKIQNRVPHKPEFASGADLLIHDACLEIRALGHVPSPEPEENQ